MIGVFGVSFIDVYFEVMLGVIIIGIMVFFDLDNLFMGVNFWWVFLNWFGGLGIIVVVMIFLLVMKVGGM